MTRLSWVLALTTPLLGACTVGSDYMAPAAALAPGFRNAAGLAQSGPPTALEGWWRGFGDPLLTRSVERALTQNQEIAQVAARLTQSRAAARAAGAALLPRAELRGSASANQLSLLDPVSQVGQGSPRFDRRYELYDLGPVASWEVDLFGGLRRGREAAEAEEQAASVTLAGTRLSIAAETADAYLLLRAYQERLAVARRQQQTAQRLVDLVQRRAAEGLSPDRELRQARGVLEGVRAAIPPLLAGEEAQLNRLDVLMGAPPGENRAALAPARPIPAAPPPVMALGPAELLRRRPDIVVAERRLAASHAQLGQSLAEYYPRISLTGLLGLETTGGAGRFLTADAVRHQLAAGLRWRLFDFGRVDAEVAVARGREAEALAAWRAAVLLAAAEVETVFSDLLQQRTRVAALERQVAELTSARAQAESAYQGGVISIIEVLDADRELLTASDQLAQSRSDVCRATIASFRALGGGWSEEPLLTATR